MSWAEVYKINKNMSKSLDEQLTTSTNTLNTKMGTVETNVKNHIKNTVEDNMSLVESDTNVYAVFPNDLMYNSGVNSSNICSITLPHKGSIRLRFLLGSSYQLGNSNYVKFNISKNGTSYAEYSSQTRVGNESERYAILEGNKGDVFTLSVSATSPYDTQNIIWLDLYDIRAIPLPSKAVTITAL